MVSATVPSFNGKLGERQMQVSGDHDDESSLQQLEYEQKQFLSACIDLRGQRSVKVLLDDGAILKFGKLARLGGMSEQSIATYLAAIHTVCTELATSPTNLITKLGNMTNAEAQAWFNDLADYFLFRRNPPIRTSTMRNIQVALLKLLEANSVHHEIHAKFHVKKRKPIPFTREEVKTILRAVSNNKPRTLWIWLLCQSFLRLGDLYTLTFADFLPFLERGDQAGLIWMDGEQRKTKERVSHDLPVSPEALQAAKQLKQEIEGIWRTTITRENAGNYPLAAYDSEPTKKLKFKTFIIEVRRIVRKTGVMGQSTGTMGSTRYTKDVHTGFRGYCLTQWEGNTWLAKWFAGHRPPQNETLNYVDYRTAEPQKKLAQFLKHRNRPFDSADVQSEIVEFAKSMGYSLDPSTLVRTTS